MSRSDVQQFGRLSDLFARACDLPEPERRALLDQECAGDAALRERLAALLHLDTASPNRFESSLVGIADVGSAVRRLAHMENGQVPVPAQLGRYRLLRVIATGGMGTVYEAEQDSPKRTVAVKLIRPGLISAQMLRRFRHEAEVLGTLHHAGVAQVYDSGTAEVATASGPVKAPFIAMELVSGRNLLDYVRDENLGIPERLALFIRICDAVQHAHHKGVIHRDLKPGNILVEPSGQPKILDFGIARLDSPGRAATLNTTPGQIVGTLAYMSPEQVVANPSQTDSRSDVYSLGVVLYELLSGRLPLRVATMSVSIAEAARIIRDDDPPTLAAVDPRFRGDLDTIATKALQKRREDRYQSAADLAGDVRRFLAHEPILARPASATYILRKFARRHRALVAGSTAAAIALVIGAIGIAIFAVQAERARALAVSNERAMRRESARSTQAAKFMKQMLSGVRPAVAAGRDRAMLREILDQTAQRIDKGELADQPLVEADIRLTIGGAYKDIGALDRAAEMLEGSLAALDRADEPQPLLRAAVHEQLGGVRQVQGQLSEAEKQYDRATQILVNAAGPQPDCDDLAHKITGSLAGLRREQTSYGEAERLLREVLAWSIQRYGPRDPQVATYLHNLGGILSDRENFPEAEKQYREALEIWHAAYGDTHPAIATVCENLGNVLAWQSKLDEADHFMTEAVRIHLASQGENNVLVARGRGNLADLRVMQHRYTEAIDLYKMAIEGFERTLKPDHFYVCFTRILLAQTMAMQGDYAGAEPVLLEGYRAMQANPEIPISQKWGALGRARTFYEDWNKAAPSDETAAKLAEWRATVGPPGVK
jgi:eukaryotic-like serine/threonine-protein kinase